MKLKREGQLQLNGEGGVAGDLRSAWTRQEDEIILSSVLEFGPKWVEIAARLPGRTEHAARNRYHRCLLYTSPSPRDKRQSRMPSSA